MLVGCPPGGNGGTGGGSAGGLTLVGGGSIGGGSTGGGTAGAPTAGGTAGASVGGGTTAGGSSGGGTAGSAGGAAAPVPFRIDQLGFDSPWAVITADGVKHLLFKAAAPQSGVFYARCDSNCATPASWAISTVRAHSSVVEDVKLAAGPDGRLHAIFRLLDFSSTSAPQPLIYATCAPGCSANSTWTQTDITAVVADNFALRGSLVVDTAGRISLLSSSRSSTADAWLVSCGSNCSAASQWQAGLLRDTDGTETLASSGTTLHMALLRPGGGFVYRRCASACTTAANWQESTFALVGSAREVAMTVSPAGSIALAFNQGMVQGSGAQKLNVWTCDSAASDCLSGASWGGVRFATTDDGLESLALVSATGGLVMLHATVTDIQVSICTNNCGDGAGWQTQVVDTTTQLAMEIDPRTVQGCTMGPAVLASWYAGAATAALGPQGEALFGWSTFIRRTCPGASSPTRLPGVGRVLVVD